GPRTTSRRGGSQGASVPSPSVTKRRSDATKRTRPTPRSAAPATGIATGPANPPGEGATGGRRAIPIGTRTATVRGRTAIAKTWRSTTITAGFVTPGNAPPAAPAGDFGRAPGRGRPEAEPSPARGDRPAPKAPTRRAPRRSTTRA